MTEITIYTCSHVRPVVKVTDSWFHLTERGTIGGQCQASVFRHPVELDVREAHHLGHVVRD